MDGTPTKYYFSCALDRRFPSADTPSSSQSTSTGVAVDPISPDDSVSVVNAPIRRVADDRGVRRRRHEARIAQIEFCKKSLTTRAKNRKDRVSSLRVAVQQHHENHYYAKQSCRRKRSCSGATRRRSRRTKLIFLG